MADSWVPLGDSQQTNHGKQGQLVLFSDSQQQVVPPANQSFQPLLQQSSTVKKMSAQAYRNLFAQETTPINVSFKANNVVFQVQKVDKVQQLLPTGHDGQSSMVSPTFNATNYHAALVSTKDKSAQPSRARAGRKDKAVAAVQNHGKPHSQVVRRNPVQPDSFMASARGANRAGGPQEDVGPKKRSRTEAAEEEDHGKEVQKDMSVFNNPVFEKNETAGPARQACREQ
jgi:hypothetical protein